MNWTGISFSADAPSIEGWCEALEGDIAWLDSAIGDDRRGQRSLLALETTPLLTWHAAEGRYAVHDPIGGTARLLPPISSHPEEPWRAIDALLRAWRADDALHGYPAGLVGFISYEGGQLFDPSLPARPHIVPPLAFHLVTAGLVGNIDPKAAPDADSRWSYELVACGDERDDAETRLERWAQWLDAHRAPPLETPEPEQLHIVDDAFPPLFGAAIANILEAIRAGRIYQACYTYPVTLARPTHSLVRHYRALRAISPGDYGGYLRFGELEIASTSPELFVSLDGATARCRPMKGTRARQRGDGDAAERANAALAEELRTSEKDRAENIMIADLMRNDLGRAAVIGTVQVEQLCEIERYETVLQMTSTVSATLHQPYDVLETIGRMMPPGSMTGAPKLEACQVIHELEEQPRGVYSGTIGWIDFGQRATFNVVIRSLQAFGDTMQWSVGGGIVFDSDPTEEWEETRTKLAALQRLCAEP